MRKWLAIATMLGGLGAEQAVSAFPIDTNNIYQNFAEVTVGSGDYFSTVIASSNAGDFAISGGCYNWGTSAKLLQSLKSGQGWRCDYDNVFDLWSLGSPLIILT